MPDQVKYSQQGRMLSIQTGEGDAMVLEKLVATESLSAPFELEMTLLSPAESLDLKKLLRTPATVTLELINGKQRYLHGYFRYLALEREGEGTAWDLAAYRGVLVPKLWFLTLDSNCRIFQNMSVQEIVEKILKENGITDYQFRLNRPCPKRVYCVQYRESSFNFISRLLEDEGIFYFFQHEKTKHTIVFSDNSKGLTACPDQPIALYTAGADSWSGTHGEGITSLERVEIAHTGKSALSDYNFEQPSLNLKTSLADANEEVFDYPGKYSAMNEGERYTRVRLEEHETDQLVINGQSRCRAFRPGYTFKLDNHFRKDTNGEYLITQVVHEVSDTTYRQDSDASHQYKNRFSGIPKATPYRPPRTARKPVVQGPQPALVVGKAGEEIWVDKYGRVKVQFYWDRLGKKNEDSSCWVRVSQIWAGKNWGWMSIPRMGQEVIVDFLEGDPDQPIITGRVYNADQMPPYTLPANQTQSGIKSRSSKGGGTEDFNEIRFEDKKGSEMFTMHAQKDMETTVENDDTQKIQHDRIITVDGKHTETITGDTSITIKQGNHSRTLDQGNKSTTLKMGNESTTLDMGNQSITLKMGNQTTKLNLGKVETSAMQSIELKVGGSKVLIDQMGVTIEGMMIKINGKVMTQVEGSAILICKGGITMIN